MRRDALWAFAFIILILAALAGKSMLLTVPSIERDPAGFDAVRAKKRIASILGDQTPHPADSAADDAVRARLIDSLHQIGLNPIVRDQMECNEFQKSRLLACARVRNVIAALGPTNSKALLLSAHYDSVPVGPGASDDGMGVATLLEVGSLLKRSILHRRVILLFDEGEELGLVGARAFLDDPLSRDVDTLLNFEARGVTGPVTMFETNHPNGTAVAAYASAVDRPFASSLSTDFARLIPNDTDVTVFKERGWVTLNFAVVGNETRYHSAGDALGALDVRSLQDMGNQALEMTRLLSAGVPVTAGNAIFFDVARQHLVVLPMIAGLVWLLALIASFSILGIHRTAIARGAIRIMVALVAGAIPALAALTIMGFLRAGTYWRAQPLLTFVALYATIAAGQIALFCAPRGKVATRDLRQGFWLIFVAVGGLLALITPGATIYFLVPPSLVLVGLGLARWYAPAEAIGAVLALIFLYASWGELLSGMEELFSPGPLWVVTPAAAMMLAPVLVEASALAHDGNRLRVLLGATLPSIAAWAIVASTPAYSADREQRFTIEHLTRFPLGESYWSVLNDGADLPAPYSAVGKWQRAKLAFSERQRWLAPAPSLTGLRAASITSREVTNDARGRLIRLRIAANGAERILIIVPPRTQIRSAGIDGRSSPVESSASSGKFTISCTGRSCDGAELTIGLRGKEPVRVTIVGSRNGLPQTAAPLVRARPLLSRPQYVPDETVTIATAVL